jgi:alpha-galactosidase
MKNNCLLALSLSAFMMVILPLFEPASAAGEGEFFASGTMATTAARQTTPLLPGRRVLLTQEAGSGNASASAAAASTVSESAAALLLAPTPPMGWNSWNMFGENINEQLIIATIDSMVSTGMRDAGYTYVCLDDGWQRYKGDRTQYPLDYDPVKFPHGIKYLADYAHAKGMKLGIYAGPGQKTCAGYTGSAYHELDDAALFASWGIDHLKYDSCCGWAEGTVQDVFQRISAAITSSGRNVVLHACNCGRDNIWTWGKNYAQYWRMAIDIWDRFEASADWPDSVLEMIDQGIGLEKYSGPNGWNDFDMLIVGLHGGGAIQGGGCTDLEYRTHFSMWSMLASPLIAGNDVRNMSAYTLETLTNSEVIALNQDALGIQAAKVRDDGDYEIFAKELQDGSWGIALLNRSSSAHTMTVNWQQDLQVPWNGATVRNLWEHLDKGTFLTGYSADVQSHEAVLLRVSPAGGNLPPNGTIDLPGQDLTVNAGDSVSFAGTGNDPDNNLPLSYRWKFGADSGIPDQTVKDPGPVQFLNPGTQVVTFTVTDALGSFDPTPATRTVTVKCGSPAVPKSSWKLLSVDSQELTGENGAATNAFDGNTATIWHTVWYRSSPPPPHEIQIDLGTTYGLCGLVYLPRQDGEKNGTISQYEFYAGTDSANWGTPVSSGFFSGTLQENVVSFTPQPARYIRLRALTEITGNPWTSAAEIGVLGIALAPLPDSTPPSVTITSPTTRSTYSTGSSSLSLAGTASDNVAVVQVTWSNSRGGSGSANGTGNWSVTGIALLSGSNVITVTARDAAGNTGTDTLTVTGALPNAQDRTSPSITITSPTSLTTYSTGSSSVNLAGSASDNVAVTQVSWTNNRGGSGTATGTGSWSATGITLQSGSNVITVTARDAAGNTGTDTLTVTYTPPTGTVTTVDDSSASITYNQTWHSETNTSCIGNDAHYTDTANAYVQFTFTGTAITWVGQKDVNFGNASVYLDGVLQATIDCYSSTDMYQQALYQKTGLANSSHTIRIVCTGTKNSRSSGRVIDIDAFRYTN